MSEPKNFMMELSVTGRSPREEKVIIEGHDISHLTRSVEITSLPGELLDVRIHLLLNSENAVRIPDCLADLSVIDDGRSFNLEVALADLLAHIKNLVSDPELDVDSELTRAVTAAEKVLGEERDQPDTVKERIKKVIW